MNVRQNGKHYDSLYGSGFGVAAVGQSRKGWTHAFRVSLEGESR